MDTKDRILTLLLEHRGESLSGEAIAGILKKSRNAVWKAMDQLRKEGYQIIAAPKKGYCLSEENDRISLPGILPFLNENSRPYAKQIQIYSSLESTNLAAKEMANAGASHGTIVLSDCQTLGRGRYSREFFSPPGGLYMSFILHPEKLSFEHITTITAFAAVAVCEAIEAVSEKRPKIKWVNDIFIDGKKVCGILTEAVSDFESGNLGWIVLGIGINIKNRTEDFPPELQSTATSLCPGETKFGLRNRLSAEIINRILGFKALPSEKKILEPYQKRLLALGRKITVRQGEKAFSATATGLDEACRLIVEKENGERILLSSGEIHISNETPDSFAK